MDVTSLVLKIADVAPNGAAMVCTLQRDLDPLDLEIVERALQGVWEGIAAGLAPLYLEIDEELERALRRELAETVRASGVTDAEALLDILFEGRGEIGWCALGVISQPVRALEGCYVVRASADARNPRVSTERAEHRLQGTFCMS